jgi:hypothetical protein
MSVHGSLKDIVAVLCVVVILVAPVGSLTAGIHALANSSSTVAPPWLYKGAYVNYSVNFQAQASFTLSNGSTISFSESGTGTYKAVIENISNGFANVTTIPDIAFTATSTAYNGSKESTGFEASPENSTSSSLIPLTRLNLGNFTNRLLNNLNSSFLFSPTLNANESSSPGEQYNFKGSTIAAIELKSSISSTAPVPPSTGVYGSYTVSGDSDVVVSVANQIPLKITIQMHGSASIQALQPTPGTPSSGTGQGSISLNLALIDTNMFVSAGTTQQASIPIPSYFSTIYLFSNSSIVEAATNENELMINLSGPSGTTGVLDVVISSGVMQRAGVSNSSEIQVTIDGEPYSNFTISSVGGSYLIAVYYHHSSHLVEIILGSAQLGSNQGTLSYITGGSSSGTTIGQGQISSSNPPTFSWIYVLPVVAILVIAIIIMFVKRRSKQATPPEASAQQTEVPTSPVEGPSPTT